MLLPLPQPQDDWPRVSQPCVAWLTNQQQASKQGHAGPAQSTHTQQQQQQQQQQSTQPAGYAVTPGVADAGVGQLLQPGGLLDQLVGGLVPAVKSGEAQGTLHARKLSTALLYAGVLEYVCIAGLGIVLIPSCFLNFVV